jgi:hypothetical protein
VFSQKYERRPPVNPKRSTAISPAQKKINVGSTTRRESMEISLSDGLEALWIIRINDSRTLLPSPVAIARGESRWFARFKRMDHPPDPVDLCALDETFAQDASRDPYEYSKMWAQLFGLWDRRGRVGEGLLDGELGTVSELQIQRVAQSDASLWIPGRDFLWGHVLEMRQDKDRGLR